MKPAILALFLLSFRALSFAQKGDKPAVSYEADYLLEEFRLPGGTIGNNVNCIVEGPYGFLWFGTHGGLHRFDGHEFVTYGPVEGDTLGETRSLTFSYIENLYWDRFHKLWVTTYGGGLYRFDPETETFKHFPANPKAPGAIPHNRVMCATEDAKGNLWFGTEKGLCRFDRKTEKFTTYYADSSNTKSLRCDQVRNLYVDKQGTLWIGTGQVVWGPQPGGISCYHPKTNTFSNYAYRKNPQDDDYLGAVAPILEDSRGNFWVGTTNGLFRMDRKTGAFTKMPFDLHAPHAPGAEEQDAVAVHAIFEDREGGLWIGTINSTNYASRLLRYDPKTQTARNLPLPSTAWRVNESLDGTIWVAGAGVGGKAWKIKPKVLEFDLQRGENIKAAFPASQLFRELSVIPGYNLIGPIDMTIDPATDVFWVQYALENFDVKFNKPALPVLASYDPKNGRCEFYLLKGLNNKKRDPNLGGNQFGASGMAVDKYGKVWGTYAHEQIGIYSFNPKTGAIQHFTHNPEDPASLSSNFILRMIMDSRGEIWAATFGEGLNRLNPETGKITRYNVLPKSNAPADEFPIAMALMEDLEGKIWAGGELNIFREPFVTIIDPATDSLRYFPLPESIRNASIRFMAQHPQNRYITFALFNEGLCDYNVEAQHFGPSNTRNGLFPFDDVASMLYDKNGDLWVASHSAGDFVFWPSLGNSNVKYPFKNKSNLGTNNRRAVIGPNNGHLYFPNEEGWAEIDPDNLNVQSLVDSSKIRLVDLYVMGRKQVPQRGGILSKPLWMLTEIALPNDAETFGFRFSDFNFRNSGSTYQYRLYPYETVWRKTDQEPVANYYRIPSGTYQFQVKAIKTGGQAATKQVELKVTMLPPWYKTWWAYLVYGLLALAAVFFLDRYQRKRIIQREREHTMERELAQAREIEKAYAELQATQAQLIQSEKLASLGELTAGIAHEIQNPLNFVNNFSELSVDLATELKEEIDKTAIPEKDKDYIGEILTDLTQNQQKINHHGKRAAAIVSGMLQHARSSTGTKEPTDLNALADEYLRLAYHGLRAKDPNFNAKMETDFDPGIGNVEVIPQDIGRVLLNLINNAFYAVQQRKRETSENLKFSEVYEPSVTVSTQKTDNQVVIKVKDNGTGIPEDVKARIFQPFFTTKPTGQGTGLGLSLAYDIVTKGHGGTLEVASEEGEGTEFIIALPVNNIGQ